MEDLLGSKTAIKILNVLFSNPSQEFKEILLIRSANAGKGAASNSIEKLIKEKFVISKRVGKTKIIKLNLSNKPVLLLKFSFDSKRLEKLPKDVLASIELLKDRIKRDIYLMIVFGSYIAGTATKESDVDILIATNKFKKVDEEKKKVEELFGKEINLHVFNKNEIFKQEDFFIKNILFKGIVVYGYDLAINLLKLPRKEPLERIEYLVSRNKSALRNYINKDYEAANSIIENVVEQLIFWILSKRNVNYTSKSDAMEFIRKEPEGKIIENIKKMDINQKIEELEKLLKGIYVDCILGEGYV